MTFGGGSVGKVVKTFGDGRRGTGRGFSRSFDTNFSSLAVEAGVDLCRERLGWLVVDGRFRLQGRVKVAIDSLACRCRGNLLESSVEGLLLAVARLARFGWLIFLNKPEKDMS